MSSGRSDEHVMLGQLNSPYGVKGWLWVYSWTSPIEGILDYPSWLIEVNGARREMAVLQGRRQGRGLVVSLAGVDSREAAEQLKLASILLPTSALPPLEPDEYYWYQLEGLAVMTTEGQPLGRVSHLFETGANDVLVVQGERERLIPFLPDEVIRHVDLAAGSMMVAWDPDF